MNDSKINLNLWNFGKSLKLFGNGEIKKSVFLFLKNWWLNYILIQYQNNGSPILVCSELDSKIPLTPKAFGPYLRYLFYVAQIPAWAKDEFGESAVPGITKLFNRNKEDFTQAGIIFRQAQTTCGRKGYGGIGLILARLLDKDLSCKIVNIRIP